MPRLEIAPFSGEHLDPAAGLLAGRHARHLGRRARGTVARAPPLARPEQACFLGFAATLREFRGMGVGVVLTNACLAWAAAEGYAAVVTDWRVTNLAASRFWPRRGFRETFLRLYRSIP